MLIGPPPEGSLLSAVYHAMTDKCRVCGKTDFGCPYDCRGRKRAKRKAKK